MRTQDHHLEDLSLGTVRCHRSLRAAGTHALILLFSFTALLHSGPSTAQQFCSANLAGCDLQTENQCLATYYACGRYDTIVQTLFVEDFAPTLDQKYFMGASFYGLYVRARSKGLECEMVKAGRQYLADYLGEKELAFAEGGSFGTITQMDQLYHATRMYESLRAIPGCVESAFTRNRIQIMSRAEAIDTSKNVFLNPPDPVRDEFDTIVLALRSFVSRASDLETGIALRRIEIQSAQNHLDAIQRIFEDIFGSVSINGTSVSVDTQVLNELETTAQGYMDDATLEQGEFVAALGGVSPEEYANIRIEMVRSAQQLLKESAFHINMIGLVMPTDTNAPFWQLNDLLHADSPGRQATEDLMAIHAVWAAHGISTGICGQGPASLQIWYCR